MDPQPMDPHQFVAEVVAAFRRIGYAGVVEHDEEARRIVLPDRGAVGLDALHSEVAGAPLARRREALEKVAAMLLHTPSLPETWEAAKDQILPIVNRRILQWIAEARRGAAGESQPEMIANITDHLLFKVGIVEGRTTMSVPLATIEAWGVEPEEAFRQAGRNLEARSGGSWLANGEFPRVYAAPWQDGHAASRLILPRAFAGVPVRGRPVVMAPTPDTVLVTGAEDEDGLFNMARFGRRLLEKHSLVHILRTVRMGEDGESWEDWLPDPGHPAHEGLRFLRVMEERADYEAQARVLAEIARGTEIARGQELMPLPPLEVQQSRFGAAVRTITRWRAGKPNALPRADYVVLIRGEETLGVVTWEELERALPAMTAVPGYPPRFLAEDFPEDWQLGEMELMPWQEAPES